MLTSLPLHGASGTEQDGVTYALVTLEQDSKRTMLAVQGMPGAPQLAAFEGEAHATGEQTLLLCPLNAHNAAALRSQLAWLRPTVLGLQTGAGLGDRLGLATPGHLRAVRAAGGHIIPLPAQQSIREMTRTGRTPQQVMDDAMWGVFAEGWRSGFGADADHLKTLQDIEYCVAAGYTFYTFDPGEYVESAVDSMSADMLRTRWEGLPWQELEDTPSDIKARYLTRPVQCEQYSIAFDDNTLMRAAVKYGRAIAHVKHMYRHLASVNSANAWEVEVSVDETETPTSHAEHAYIASELRRLNVHCVSLAPRYIGQFEKGVDYIGDVAAFEADIAVHAAIARTLGPYKLSLHSGSDKFSVYEPAARQTRGMVHLKTAGTSYLEALRTIATLNPSLLRAIYSFARVHYEADRASYHVSARLERSPLPNALSDSDLPALLEQFDAREIMHVTFGSVLTAKTPEGNWLFYEQIMELLRANPEAYAANLQTHFLRHLRPFVPWSMNVALH